MSFKDIRHVQQDVWPDVERSVKLQDASRVAGERLDPRVLSKSARNRLRIPRDRVIADETVWAIARADLLAVPEAAEVIRAAREWLKVMGPCMAEFPEDYEPVDFVLRDALNAYATIFHIDNDENLTDEQLVGTVTAPRNNH